MKRTYTPIVLMFLSFACAANAQLIPNVNPGAPTEITNTKSAPVQMQDVEDPLLDPVQFNLSLDLGAGVMFGFSSGYTVPAGKWLVITSAVFRANKSSGLSDVIRANLHTTVAGSQALHPFRMQRLFQAAIGSVMGVIKTRMYADPGTTVQFASNHTDASFTSSYIVAIQGYLEKVQ